MLHFQLWVLRPGKQSATQWLLLFFHPDNQTLWNILVLVGSPTPSAIKGVGLWRWVWRGWELGLQCRSEENMHLIGRRPAVRCLHRGSCDVTCVLPLRCRTTPVYTNCLLGTTHLINKTQRRVLSWTHSTLPHDLSALEQTIRNNTHTHTHLHTHLHTLVKRMLSDDYLRQTERQTQVFCPSGKYCGEACHTLHAQTHVK